MTAQLKQAIAALCMGRTGKALIAEAAAVLVVVGILWIVACAFALLEPLS